MKRTVIVALITCLVLLAGFAVYYNAWERPPEIDVLKVGFVYENDESAPFTYNFYLSQRALEQQMGERVEIISRSNVLENETETPLRELAGEGCGIIFAITDSDQVMGVAEKCPQTQFCQVSRFNTDGVPMPANYHTFNARMDGVRYLGGVAAGMKLRELLDAGQLSPEEALVGFVGAKAKPEVISAYTAFLLGVRSVAPEARMLVKYTDTWCSYSREKAAAEALILKGCRVITQQTHTNGPVAACDAAAEKQPVFLVGSDQNTIDLAPMATLVSVRPNWTPYVTGAVEAVLSGRRIERSVAASANGSDLWAGLDRDWAQVLEVNALVAAPDTQAQLDRLAEQLRSGRLSVFTGDYRGVDPENPADTVDLKNGYPEYERSSYPTFHYVLEDYITVLE